MIASLNNLVNPYLHHVPIIFTTHGSLVAVLLLPFFVFNWYFHYEVPVLTSIGMLDFAGNVTMLALAIMGWRAAKAEAV